MAQSRDPAPVHRVTLDKKSIESASTPPFQGPLYLNAYLYCFDAVTPPPAYPAYLVVAIYQGPGVDFNLVWTVTAAATEIQYPEYPIQSAATFWTNTVRYDYSGQALGVGFEISGSPDSPLRLGIMATLGGEVPRDAPAESVQPSAPRVVRAAYRVRGRQPTEDAHKDLGMRQPYRPSERPLHTISAEGGLLPEQSIGGVIVGPFNVTSFLFCSANENEWLRPGFNTLLMDLRELGIGTVWTVNADVTELSPPDTPWTGDALFETLGVQLDFRSQRAFVYCRLEWGAALPVAVMLTLGHAPAPSAESPGKTARGFAVAQPDQPPENQDVTLSTTSANAPPPTPRYTRITGVHGGSIWEQRGYLFVFADPDQSNWARPGSNIFEIDLNGLNLGTVWTVNADVVELLSVDYPEPHIGDAGFEIIATTYNLPAQIATVTFNLGWNAPLPVGIMTNIGFLP